jgi:hypothetical protein
MNDNNWEEEFDLELWRTVSREVLNVTYVVPSVRRNNETLALQVKPCRLQRADEEVLTGLLFWWITSCFFWLGVEPGGSS